MRIFLILVITGFSLSLNAQNLFTEQFSDCESEFFYLEGKDIISENLNEDLIADVINSIDPKTVKKIKGTIKIQVFIDSIGTPCCLSMKNDLNSKGKSVNFKEIINTKTKWSPPVKDGESTCVSLILRISFQRNRIILQRMGYNSNSGMTIQKRMEINR